MMKYTKSYSLFVAVFIQMNSSIMAGVDWQFISDPLKSRQSGSYSYGDDYDPDKCSDDQPLCILDDIPSDQGYPDPSEYDLIPIIQRLNESVSQVNQSLKLQIENIVFRDEAFSENFQKSQEALEQQAKLLELVRYNISVLTRNTTEENKEILQQLEKFATELSQMDERYGQKIQSKIEDVKAEFNKDHTSLRGELQNIDNTMSSRIQEIDSTTHGSIQNIESNYREFKKESTQKLTHLGEKTSTDMEELQGLIQGYADRQSSYEVRRDEEANGLKNMIKELQDLLHVVEKSVGENKVSDDDLRNEFNQFVLQTNEHVSDSNSKLASLEDQLQKLKLGQRQLEIKLRYLERHLRNKLYVQRRDFDGLVSQTEEINHQHKDKLNSHDDQLIKLQRELRTLTEQFEKSEREQNNRIERTYTRTVGIESDVKIRQDFLHLMTYFISGVSCCFGLFVCIYMVYWPRGGGHARDTVVKNPPQVNTNPSILQGDRGHKSHGDPRVSLSPAVCIVGFSDSTISRHEQCAQSVCDGVTLHTHVVHGLQLVTHIPKDALCLVFVDYNERNVILEEAGLIQGELRVKTVKYLIKTGADVFVIYTGDQGSKTLNSEYLYNTNLTSVHKHNILLSLKRRNRVLSINYFFNKAQQHVLSEAINNLCELL